LCVLSTVAFIEVFHYAYLFHGTIVDNPSFGRIQADMDELHDAARSDKTHEFIAQLPKPHGYWLTRYRHSGDQRQRFAITRASLCDAPDSCSERSIISRKLRKSHQTKQALDRLK
jgi:ABC-type multidrug transport system fused ATPase/permease subunit